MQKLGFTLIEIVIVLAIAAIIMSAVFLGVLGAQRSQRDATRRNAADRAMSQIYQYRSNNGGSDPTDWAAFDTNYLGGLSSQGMVFTTSPYPATLPACTSAGSTDLYYQAGAPGKVFVCLEAGDYYATP